MSQFVVKEFYPACTIEAWTWRGQHFAIHPYMMDWQTAKTMTQSQGTFQIDVTAFHNAKGQTLYDMLLPMDYIEIRATPDRVGAPSPYPIILRGFVDQVQQTITWGQKGGPIEPRITITGRDYVKLLQVWQILYLYSQNVSNVERDLTQYVGLTENYGIKSSVLTTNQFVEQVMTKIINPVVTNLNKAQLYTHKLASIGLATNMPPYGMSAFTINNYSGSYWNLLQYINSPPYGELFLIDEEEGPVLTARLTAYKQFDGTIPAPGHPTPSNTTKILDSVEIVQYQVQRTDTDVYTYYLTYGDITQSQNKGSQSLATYVEVKGNGVFTGDQTLWGIRPLQEDIPWINTFTNNGNTKPERSQYQDASILNEWLVNVTRHNYLFESGTITVQGRPDYKIGRYLNIPTLNREFYISGVTHQFVNFSQWTTQLQVIRGRPLNNQMTSPI